MLKSTEDRASAQHDLPQSYAAPTGKKMPTIREEIQILTLTPKIIGTGGSLRYQEQIKEL